MQVWQFAAKRSQLPNWNVLYGSLKWAYQWALGGLFQNGTKRTETPTHRPTRQWAFQLDKTRNRSWGGELFPPSPKEEMDRSVGWNELSGEWCDYCSKCLPPTVCKHAVSKSRPSSGNITAQHHTTPTPSSQHRTQDRYDLSPLPHTGLMFLFLGEADGGCGSVTQIIKCWCRSLCWQPSLIYVWFLDLIVSFNLEEGCELY